MITICIFILIVEDKYVDCSLLNLSFFVTIQIFIPVFYALLQAYSFDKFGFALVSIFQMLTHDQEYQ